MSRLELLLSNHFVAVAVDSGDVVACGKLFQIPMYTRADFFNTRYGVKFVGRTGGRNIFSIKDSLSNAQLWSSPDDVFSSVGRAVLGEMSEKYPECKPLPHSNDSKVVGAFALGDCYNAFDRNGFEAHVLPWLATNREQQHHKYVTAAHYIHDLEPPGNCAARDLYRWGIFYNALANILSEWRKEKRPLPIIREIWEFHPDEAKCFNDVVAKWDGGYVIPAGGADEFGAFELPALVSIYKTPTLLPKATTGHQTDVIVKDQLLDPFTFFGSRFIVLDDLPTLVPRELATPTPPTTPAKRPAETEVVVRGDDCEERTVERVNLDDEFGPMRRYLMDYAVSHFDLNTLTSAERDGLKSGVPHTHKNIETGRNWFTRLSKQRQSQLSKVIPSGTRSFPEWVESFKSYISKPEHREGVAWWLACKAVLGRAQYPCLAEGGEVYLTKQ